MTPPRSTAPPQVLPPWALTPLGSNPPGSNPPGEDSTQGSNPPGENDPQGQNSTPPLENKTPPSEKADPPSEFYPPMDDAPPLGPTISDGLRADLCKAWVLGFLDCMKGEQVNADDAIPLDVAEKLVKLSQGCVDHSASLIAKVMVDSPQAVDQTVYAAGFEACLSMNLKAEAQLNRN